MAVLPIASGEASLETVSVPVQVMCAGCGGGWNRPWVPEGDWT